MVLASVVHQLDEVLAGEDAAAGSLNVSMLFPDPAILFPAVRAVLWASATREKPGGV